MNGFGRYLTANSQIKVLGKKQFKGKSTFAFPPLDPPEGKLPLRMLVSNMEAMRLVTLCVRSRMLSRGTSFWTGCSKLREAVKL
jgi:hypothetical protein